MLKMCLVRGECEFERKQYSDYDDDTEKVLVAECKLKSMNESKEC